MSGILSVRTAREIKQELLRRVVNGTSSRSPQEMRELILKHLRRARDIPEDHLQELERLREEGRFDDELRAYLKNLGITDESFLEEARAIVQLNILERLNGSGRKWSSRGKDMEALRRLSDAPPTPTIN